MWFLGVDILDMGVLWGYYCQLVFDCLWVVLVGNIYYVQCMFDWYLDYGVCQLFYVVYVVVD